MSRSLHPAPMSCGLARLDTRRLCPHEPRRVPLAEGKATGGGERARCLVAERRARMCADGVMLTEPQVAVKVVSTMTQEHLEKFAHVNKKDLRPAQSVQAIAKEVIKVCERRRELCRHACRQSEIIQPARP